MPWRIRIPFITILLVCGVAFAAPHARAARLFPQDVHARVAPGKTVLVPILLDSEGKSINVVEARVTYPKGLLEVVAVPRGRSFLSLWAEEPSVDRDFGVVSLVGGFPNGTTVSDGVVIDILFRVRATGEATVSVDPDRSSVYLNDGAGTRATLTSGATRIHITAPDALAPTVTSPTHPDEARWYPSRIALLTWQRYPGATYSYQVSPNPAMEPDDGVEELPAGEQGIAQYPGLTDGVWYFTLKERLIGDPWGPIGRFRIQVDGAPPIFTEARIVGDALPQKWLISFAARDGASGVDYYEIQILRPRIHWFPFSFHGEWVRTANPHILDQDMLFSEIAIRAVDLAGNATTVTLPSPTLSAAQRRFVLQGVLTAATVGVFLVLLLFVRRQIRRSATRRRRS